jgi:hydroxyacylglutathione hydrolase
VRIDPLDTPCLGNRSYVITDGSAAIVVDPPRDIDRVEALIDAAGATRITLVVETHRHADYVSGGLQLSRRHHADYVVPPGDPEPRFDFRAARPGDVFGADTIGVRVVATPGHTPHHVAHVIESADVPLAVCTGGSLLHGTVGRTDLYGEKFTRPLAHAQWQSARRLLDMLPTDIRVLPTHGFGSLCSAGGATGAIGGTLGEEVNANSALQMNEKSFVEMLVSGYGPIPRHYGRLPLVNAAGPQPVDLSPAPAVDPRALQDIRVAGDWLVDVRDRRSFARAHVRGSVNVEATGPLVAYLPWILPPGAGVVLIGDSDSVDSAARQLAQVGIDRPVGVAIGDPQRWAATDIASYDVATFDGFLEATTMRGGALALDVRSEPEWAAGHVRGAMHFALPDLAETLDPSPRTAGIPTQSWARGEVWVYCGGGFRAAVAASLLSAAGVRVTLVDEPFGAAEAAGLTARDTPSVSQSGQAGRSLIDEIM